MSWAVFENNGDELPSEVGSRGAVFCANSCDADDCAVVACEGSDGKSGGALYGLYTPWVDDVLNMGGAAELDAVVGYIGGGAALGPLWCVGGPGYRYEVVAGGPMACSWLLFSASGLGSAMDSTNGQRE